MMDKMMGEEKGMTCKCPHHHTISVLVVLFALLFFFRALGWFSDYFVDLAWPVLVGIAGLTKLCSKWCKCC